MCVSKTLLIHPPKNEISLTFFSSFKPAVADSTFNIHEKEYGKGKTIKSLRKTKDSNLRLLDDAIGSANKL